jgi:Tat protein translocase TatB subunit
MFGSIGTGEIVLIAGIALIVIGPEKFPQFAKIALRAFRDLRGYVTDLKSEVGNELNPIRGEFRELARQNPEDYIESLVKAVEEDLEEEEDILSETSPTEAVESVAPTTTEGVVGEAEQSATPEDTVKTNATTSTPYDDVYDPERMEH